jgi:hypothetical protein
MTSRSGRPEIVREMVDGWHGLLTLAASGPTVYEFKGPHDAWAKRWMRLSYEQQGEISHHVSNNTSP